MGDDREAVRFGEALMNYLPKLIRRAELNMSQPLQARVGADDLANSVIGSVFRMYSQGKLKVNIEDEVQFGQYLIVVALNKIRKKAREHGALKRNISLDQPLSDLEFLVHEAPDPTDEEGKEVVDVLNRLESELDADGKLILQGKIEGLLNWQIAEKLNGGQGVSTKTVIRRWNDIQLKLRRIIEEMDLC